MEEHSGEDIEIERDGLTLRGYVQRPRDVSAGRMVVCMHGFLRDMGREPGNLYQDLANALVDAGFTCVRFDFNGRGSSDGAFADSDVLNQIEDAIAVLEHVRRVYSPAEISLLGHSQGGVVAGMTAGLFPDVVRSLVMLAPAAAIKDDALRGRLLGVPFDVNRVPETITLRSGQRVDGKFVRIAQMLPIVETTAMFRGPALVVQGTDDQVVGDRGARDYAAAMPNCETSLYAHLGHAFDGADREVAIGEAVRFLVEQEEAA